MQSYELALQIRAPDGGIIALKSDCRRRGCGSLGLGDLGIANSIFHLIQTVFDISRI